MADIRPFKGWRYNEKLGQSIEEHTSPLFDVVSGKQREKLYKNPFSSIHLSVPAGSNPAASARETLISWKNKKILNQDPIPHIYVYYQYFTLPGSLNEYCRKGFISNVRIYEWEEKVLLRHENTMPHSVNDRKDLLKFTGLHVSPTHGLYTDESHELEQYMDDAMKNPIYVTEDYQGVKDVFGVIQDYKIISRFVDVLKEKSIILADGHHRYEGALWHLQEMRKKNPKHTGNEGYNFQMMYLTNTESDDIKILPTHRLVHGLENFSETRIMKEVEKYFIIKPVEDAFTLNEVIAGKPWAFGLLFKEKAFKIRLIPEMAEKVKWPFPDVIKKLDLTILHYYFLEKILNIHGRDQRETNNISYDRNFSDCYARVLKDEVQMALIVNELNVKTVKQVCESGYTLPQKSTYFYPKVLSGFVFSSIIEDEFTLSFNPWL